MTAAADAGRQASANGSQPVNERPSEEPSVAEMPVAHESSEDEADEYDDDDAEIDCAEEK